MSPSEKLSITLPAEVAARVERLRKKTGETRSAFILRAVQEALARKAEQIRSSQYRRGYTDQPEVEEEIKAAEAAAGELLGREPWD